MRKYVSLEKAALMHASTCFLNSLLREWDGYEILRHFESRAIKLDKCIAIPLAADERLVIPLVKDSPLGRHQYDGRFYLQRGWEVSLISFQELVERLCDHLADLFGSDLDAIAKFKGRVFDSLKNVHGSLHVRETAIRELHENLDFKSAEQGLIVGHNFHPTPKSRDGFEAADLMCYAPEFGGQFRIEWLMADPSILYEKRASSFGDRNWTMELAIEDLSETTKLVEFSRRGFVPVPMHPWQKDVLLKDAYVRELFASGLLVSVGTSRADWYPTSSLRSIYRNEAPFMLKYSMTVRLTNSVRHLLAHEVERGLQLRDVLATEKGQEFLRKYPAFKVITEPAFLALKDVEGKPMTNTIIVCRENPFRGVEAEGKVVLATLAQDAPLGGENLIQKLIRQSSGGLSLSEGSRRWFNAYLSFVVRPLVMAQANYGIVMGAHQQNVILDLRDGFPVGSYFRDCQGTGYSELGYANFAKDVPLIYRENGNVLNEKMGNYLFTYYLILNSTFNVISAITSSGWISDRELLNDLREFLRGLRGEDVRDSSCLDYILESDTLMHKGNFLCSFRNINENTTVDPLAIYTPIKNPLKPNQDVSAPKLEAIYAEAY